MSSQKLPKVVAEVLKDISEKVKEFNKTSKLELIAKVSFEENNEEEPFFEISLMNFQDELYFQIIEYDTTNLANDEIFTVHLDEDVLSKFNYNSLSTSRLVNRVQQGGILSKPPL